MKARRLALACGAIALAATALPVEAAQMGPLTQAAVQAVNRLQPVANGSTIVILSRSDNDLATFYQNAMQKLCTAAPDNNWCDTDLYSVLTDTTNQYGWSRILTYSGSSGGQGQVCALLPPSSDVGATTLASGIGGGQVYDWRDLPTQDEAIAWAFLRLGAMCEMSGSGTDAERKIADAFASLSLTLIEGSPAFVGAQDVTPARKFGFYDRFASTAWATNVGERILLELWKGQAASILQSGGCTASAAGSSGLNTPAIQRDTMLPPGGDCNPDANGKRNGSVTDANLWLWSTNGGSFTPTWPVVSLPPKPYTPWQSFPDLKAGITYAWTTAISVAKQY